MYSIPSTRSFPNSPRLSVSVTGNNYGVNAHSCKTCVNKTCGWRMVTSSTSKAKHILVALWRNGRAEYTFHLQAPSRSGEINAFDIMSSTEEASCKLQQYLTAMTVKSTWVEYTGKFSVSFYRKDDQIHRLL